MNQENQIVIYQAEDGQTKIDVRLEDETVWLTANQMAVLFDRDEKTIRKHINNVFREGELEKTNNTHFLRVDGVKQKVACYNLDVIISVGYRVKSKSGTAFRIWARQIIKDYLIKGYAINDRIRVNEQMIAKLEETAQALYRKMFVDGIDKENLPEGWRRGKIQDFCKEMKSGGTPSRNHNEYWDKQDYPWLKSGEVRNNIISSIEEYISQSGLDNSSAKIIPQGSVIMAMYGATAAQVAYLECNTTTNQACCNMICHSKENAAYLFFHI